jgi:hypothetical protein
MGWRVVGEPMLDRMRGHRSTVNELGVRAQLQLIRLVPCPNVSEGLRQAGTVRAVTRVLRHECRAGEIEDEAPPEVPASTAGLRLASSWLMPTVSVPSAPDALAELAEPPQPTATMTADATAATIATERAYRPGHRARPVSTHAHPLDSFSCLH